MLREVVKRKGKRFVLVEERELRRLERLAAKSQAADEADKVPSLPPADEQGRRPALAFARASIARSIVEERRAAGLSQEELAPTVRTVAKIDKALQAALAKAAKVAKPKKGK
jgi:ribosome-binding protein aMBF1 (putative translation factor)